VVLEDVNVTVDELPVGEGRELLEEDVDENPSDELALDWIDAEDILDDRLLERLDDKLEERLSDKLDERLLDMMLEQLIGQSGVGVFVGMTVGVIVDAEVGYTHEQIEEIWST
jgi:hypothetical protein